MSDQPNTPDEGIIVGEGLNLDPPRAREPGMLTYGNREYLYNPADYSADSHPTQRMRVRNRITNALLDGWYLRAVSPNDRRLIFEDGEAGDEMYEGIQELIQFIYTGLNEETTVDFELLLEAAIEAAERDIESSNIHQFSHVNGVDVSIEIDKQRVVILDSVKAKVKNREPLTDREIAALVREAAESEEYEQVLEQYRDRLEKQKGGKQVEDQS